MSKELIVSATSLETKIAILEDDQATQVFIERDRSKSILGNIYKGKVTRVLPGMQAAFVDIGLDRNAFLYVSDFFEDYEDYESLFDKTDRNADDFYLDQSESGNKTKRKGKRQKKASPKTSARKKPARTGKSRPRQQEKPQQYSDPRILPDRLSEDSGENTEILDASEPGQGILPHQLPDPKRASREAEALENGEAKLETRLDVSPLKTTAEPKKGKQNGKRKGGLITTPSLRNVSRDRKRLKQATGQLNN